MRIASLRSVAALFALSLVTIPNIASAYTSAHLWSKNFSGGPASGTDEVNGIAVDNNRNVIIVGFFDGTINFGGSDLVGNAGDIFIAKFSPTGQHIWSKRIGGPNPDYAYCVATDNQNRIWVGGTFSGTVDFGVTYFSNAGSQDGFLAVYTPEGLWAGSRQIGGPQNDAVNGIATDPAGGAVATGVFTGSVSFGAAVLTSAGSWDVFVAKYNSSASNVWANRYGSTGDEIGSAIAVDSFSQVIVGGSFSTNISFGGPAFVSAGSFDIFMAKLNSTGAHQWSKSFGSAGSDGCYGATVDASGNAIFSGHFSSTVNFGGGNLTSAGGADAFLAKYDSNGNHRWSKRFGGTSAEQGFAVDAALDGSDEVALTGYIWSATDFGGGALTLAPGAHDVYMAKFAADGSHLWSRGAGASSAEGRAVAFDGKNVFAGGNFGTSGDFGAGTIPAPYSDAFIAKYGSNASPVINTINDIGNDQGRKVKITFARSGDDDVDAVTPVTSYEAYRLDAPPPSAAVLDNAATSSRQQLLDAGWTQVGSVGAHAQSAYGMDVPTIGDSTIALGQYLSTFFVRSVTSKPSYYFDSSAANGYSVDNLAPGIPGLFALAAGNLTWNESTAEDFDYFTVYGANTNSFGTATLVNYTVGTNMNVSGSPYGYYFVTATDFSGNEGRPAIVNALSGVGGTPSSYVLSVSNYPNPFNPRTTVKYTVPSRGHVSVKIYDAAGAYIVTLVDRDHSAGAFTVDWDGRSNGSAVGSGVYFARIEQNGEVRTRKLTLLK